MTPRSASALLRVRLRGGGCGGSKAGDIDASVGVDAIALSFIQDLDSDEPSPRRHQKLFVALLEASMRRRSG